MRIAFVLPGYPWSPMGGFRVVYEYANHLVARGHDVSVVHTRTLRNMPPSPGVSLRRWLGHKRDALRDRLFTPEVSWQSIDKNVRIKYVPEIREALMPDGEAVFATFWLTAEEVLALPATKGVKFHLIQGYETWAGPQARVDATWRAPLRKVVVSRWLYERGKQLGCNQMRYIPNGLDLKTYCLKSPIAPRAVRATMMYSQVELKGAHDGLKALEVAKAQHPELQATIFGMPARPMSLPTWIEYRRDPAQRVLVDDVYNSARIFLCSSWVEGFALPPAEAMACGCAVVSTDCGGNRDFATDGVTALLSQPKDPRALADNLIRLLEDDELRIRIATEGHKRIQAFTWERSTDHLENYIKECVGNGKRTNQGEHDADLTCRSTSRSCV